MKVGIFGGSFNPPHMGHINSLQTVAKKAGLEKIYVIPSSQNPLKIQVEGATPEQRLAMTKKAFEGFGAQYVVDDQELKRGGKSYTIDTIKNLRKTYKPEELNLIIGMDNFECLEGWKDLSGLLNETNIIVTSRPGFSFPGSLEEMPPTIKNLTEEFDFNFVELKTGRHIQFINLQDVEVSATEIRKWIRVGKKVEQYVPLSVEGYIRDNKIYAPIGNKVGDYKKFTEFCAKYLDKNKAIQVKAFDLREMSAPSEFSLVASGTSTKHAGSLAENLVRGVKEEYNVLPQSIEGVDEGRWVVLDYGSLIVHVFYDFVRQEYRLENLWKEAKPIEV